MKLNQRLLKIASLVQPKSIVLDIGCDHGFLSIYLIKNDIATHVYASDVNKEPLANAQTNIKDYQLENEITTILSNGLDAFQDINFDTIIIAGMGGSLIIDILKDNIELLKDKHLILQPNINDNGLRKFLLANGFEHANDHLVSDNNIVYDIIEVNSQPNIKLNNSELSEVEYLIGYYNILRNDELVHQKFIKIIKKYERLLSEIPAVNEKYSLIKKTLKELVAKKDELETINQ